MNSTDVKVGDFVSFTSFAKVDRASGHTMWVTDLDQKDSRNRSMDYKIEGKALIESGKSASQFNRTEKITSTELIQKLITCFNIPFTVNFDKDDGSNRTLVGRLQSPDPLRGRSYVEDLEKMDGHPRLVNHRALHWLIVDGVKYTTK